MLEQEMYNLKMALKEFLTVVEEELKLKKILDAITKFLKKEK